MLQTKRKLGQEAGPIANGLTFLIWLATSAVALYEVYLVRQIFFRILGRTGIEYQTINVLGIVLMLALAGVAVSATVAAGEVHRRHVGLLRSVQVFTVTIGIEAAILMFYHFL